MSINKQYVQDYWKFTKELIKYGMNNNFIKKLVTCQREMI